MRTAIEGVRPALISMESYQYLDEIRGFRHVFRHAYSYGLDDERVLFEKSCILHGLALIGVRSVLGIENVKGSPFNVQ